MPKYNNRNKETNPPYSFSQNFLTSKKTLKFLLSKTDISKTDHVIEIGAGKGHITRMLSDNCKYVTSYEIDKTLYNTLESTKNVKFICKDFLETKLPGKIPYKVFSNIPFSITTDIVRKLTTADNPPNSAWLIMEYGSAMRFSGLPYDKAVSLSLKPFFNVEILCKVNRREFHPMPSVDAALLHIEKRRDPDLPLSQRNAFCDFVKHGMQEGFSGKKGLLTKKQVSTALRLAGLEQLHPSETMRYVQWLCLFRCWDKFCGNSK